MLSAVTWLNTAVQVFAASAIGAPAVPRQSVQPLGARNHVVVSAQHLAPTADVLLTVPDLDLEHVDLAQPIISHAVAGPKTTLVPASKRRAALTAQPQLATRGSRPVRQIGAAAAGEPASARIPGDQNTGVKAAQTMTPAAPKTTTTLKPTSQRKEAVTLTVRPPAPEHVEQPESVTGAAPIPLQPEPADDGSTYIFGPSN